MRARNTRTAWSSYLNNKTVSMPLSLAASTIFASMGRPEMTPVAVHAAHTAVCGRRGLPKNKDMQAKTVAVAISPLICAHPEKHGNTRGVRHATHMCTTQHMCVHPRIL